MNKSVLEIARVNLRGNVIDHGWFEHITLKNGKPYMVAIAVLSEIVYWYKPTEVRDEETNEITYKQKFKADKLQKSYQQLADSFGFTKRQVKDACDYLKEKQLIDTEFRTILVGNIPHSNVMFVEPIVDNIRSISKLYKDPVTTESKTLLRSNVRPPYDEAEEGGTTERKTYTKSTTGISTGINSTTTTTTENAFVVYEQNLGQLKPLVIQDINYWLDQFNDQHDILIAAMKIAVKRNKTSFGYAEGILKGWINKGAKNINDVRAIELENKPKVNIGTHTKQNGGYTNERAQQNSGNTDTSEYDNLSL